MKTNRILSVLAVCALVLQLHAQQYVSPTAPAETGKSPGVKIKLVHTEGRTQTYVLIFSPGDELKSGLTEFAQRYHVGAAYFTGIGDAVHAKLGWYDSTHKAFKVIDIQKPAEISSLIGNITLSEGKPTVHAHLNLADENGISHGGHLLELYTGPTIEIMVTVFPETLDKQKDPKSGAALIMADK